MSIQVPLFMQGDDAHSSISSSHLTVMGNDKTDIKVNIVINREIQRATLLSNCLDFARATGLVSMVTLLEGLLGSG